MESSYVVVFSCVAGGLLLVSILSTLIGWARLKGVEERLEAVAREMLTKSEPKQLELAQASASSAQSMVQTALLELGKYKEQVHGEMQRFYAIMRRNEKASGFVPGQQAAPAAVEVPDEISAASLQPVDEDGGEPISKATLRKKARDAGL